MPGGIALGASAAASAAPLHSTYNANRTEDPIVLRCTRSLVGNTLILDLAAMRALANCFVNSADDASRVCQSLSENDCATAKQNGLHWDIELTFDAAMQLLDSNNDSPECAVEWRLRAPRTA